jgi:hypothetical protein
MVHSLIDLFQELRIFLIQIEIALQLDNKKLDLHQQKLLHIINQKHLIINLL